MRSPRTKERIERILELKAQGWTDRLIKKDINAQGHEYARYLRYIGEKYSFKDEALSVCNEAIARMHDTRQRMMLLARNLEAEKKWAAAAAVYKRIAEVDAEMVRTAQQLGVLQLPEQRHRFSVDDPKLLELTDEQLYEEYRAQSGQAERIVGKPN